MSVYLAAFSEVKDMKVVRECMRLQEKIYPEYFSSLLIGTDASLSLKTNYNWDLLKKTLQNCDELKSVTLMKQEGIIIIIIISYIHFMKSILYIS